MALLEALALVTVTVVLVVALPMRSYALAVTAWLPLATAAEFHVAEYGDVVAVPTMLPSTRNSTRPMPVLSAALAVSVTVPETVAPAVGAVTATVGGSLSAT